MDRGSLGLDRLRRPPRNTRPRRLLDNLSSMAPNRRLSASLYWRAASVNELKPCGQTTHRRRQHRRLDLSKRAQLVTAGPHQALHRHPPLEGSTAAVTSPPSRAGAVRRRVRSFVGWSMTSPTTTLTMKRPRRPGWKDEHTEGVRPGNTRTSSRPRYDVTGCGGFSRIPGVVLDSHPTILVPRPRSTPPLDGEPERERTSPSAASSTSAPPVDHFKAPGSRRWGGAVQGDGD